MKIELFEDKAKKWRMRLVAGNNRIWESGEAYATKSNARRASRAFVKSAEAGIPIMEAGEPIAPDVTHMEQESHAVTIHREMYNGSVVTHGVTLDGITALCVPDGEPVLVTNPIGRMTTVTVTLIASDVAFADSAVQPLP